MQMKRDQPAYPQFLISIFFCSLLRLNLNPEFQKQLVCVNKQACKSHTEGRKSEGRFFHHKAQMS